MNPFLHSTVAQPSIPQGAAVLPVRRRRVRLPSAPRVSRVLRAAGLAALTWAGAAGAVDLNTATLDQLRGIRGIGPKTAQIILDERSRGGRYLSFADLSDRVRGIGPRRAQALQSAGLTIDGGGTRLSGQGGAASQAARAARPADAAGAAAAGSSKGRTPAPKR
ncbi:helix-hairpin-helix domain-containing protein [uncultured Castellaniella sp.]|uniref:ComEA family DNA-binding protein n=1 Tax=uncultured Castellaniella sp. TaxID=647907 RepID=UPI0026031829|nr:helix-hairpin-helix domain-containing protein [uncultured Castellaniella sp.]